MDWATIQDAIKAWAAAQSGLTASWRNELESWVTQDRLWLQILSSNDVGHDEIRYTTNGGAAPEVDQEPTFSGLREFTLQITCESRDQYAASHAIHHLEVLRASLYKPSVVDAFTTAKIAVADILAVTQQDREYEGRWISQASMDVLFNSVSNVTDTDEATGLIDKAEISTTMEEGDSDLDWDEVQFGNV